MSLTSGSPTRSATTRQLVIGAITGFLALAVFLLFCVPASPLALPNGNARLGLALLCGVMLLFAVGFAVSGRWTFDISLSPWRATDPTIREWIVWAMDVIGAVLVILSFATGLLLIGRSVLA